MKDYVIAVKDHYENIRGSKKVKVLTKGKKYVYISSSVHLYAVINDLEMGCAYKKKFFTTVSNSRNNKLELLGI